MCADFETVTGLRGSPPIVRGSEERATLSKSPAEMSIPTGLRLIDADLDALKVDSTPLGLLISVPLPRVASPSFVKSTTEGRQPWALMHNPFRIEGRHLCESFRLDWARCFCE